MWYISKDLNLKYKSYALHLRKNKIKYGNTLFGVKTLSKVFIPN